MYDTGLIDVFSDSYTKPRLLITQKGQCRSAKPLLFTLQLEIHIVGHYCPANVPLI